MFSASTPRGLPSKRAELPFEKCTRKPSFLPSDLCDVLSTFSPQGKATLHDLCRVMGLPGKPSGINGGEVEPYYRQGRIREIADYCEGDVVNTYQVWLRYELFRGRLTHAGVPKP
jgi:predicted PolB exonuclease-like 3'-5' exonuclease